MNTDTFARLRRGGGLRALAGLAVFVLIILAVIVAQRFTAPSSYLLQIPTADASGIFPGSDVTIAGVNAGSVRSVRVSSGGDAVITAAINPSFTPVHTSATAQIRPKSLLGEMYVALDPGTAGAALPSDATLPRIQVNRATDLQQVFNTFDQPTRVKLQTLIDELGGGLAGRGGQLNQSIPAGAHDLSDLSKIASTLNARNSELQSVIANLNTVTTELARSDRRHQLGLLIQSTNQLMASLRGQQAQLQRAVTQADFALGNLHQGLQGTAPSLSAVASTLPSAVQASNQLLVPLGTGSRAVLPQLSNLISGIQEGPSVFGGRDANGYATRISLVVGCSSVSLCPQLANGLGGLTGGAAGTGSSAGSAGSSGSSSGAGSGGSQGQGILGFLLGGKS
ncbi:MAG: MCE family protein [Actinobacteria bacterium]|nr:MCE family protein [Actinomycetota bacterium]